LSELFRPALPLGREAEAAVLPFRFMSDQEPEPTADETATAGIKLLEELLGGTTTAQSGVLDANNTVNSNG
jgi:hypothetical protein